MQKEKLEQRLTKSAFAYLDRYGSSVQNLKTVLHRKARRIITDLEDPDFPLDEIIDRIAEKCLSYGFVNDDLYAESKVSGLRRRGTSERKIRAKLASKGVQQETVDAALDKSTIDDEQAAFSYTKRRRLGAFRRTKEERIDRREKDIAALCRAGFSVSLAIKVIDADGEGI